MSTIAPCNNAALAQNFLLTVAIIATIVSNILILINIVSLWYLGKNRKLVIVAECDATMGGILAITENAYAAIIHVRVLIENR